MIEETLIDKRIVDLQQQILPQDIHSTTIMHGRIDILFWAKGKTRNEIEMKIKRIEEEMIPLQESNLWFEEKTARIKELLHVLDPEKHPLLLK